jgi:hypothetical protein
MSCRKRQLLFSSGSEWMNASLFAVDDCSFEPFVVGADSNFVL